MNIIKLFRIFFVINWIVIYELRKLKLCGLIGIREVDVYFVKIKT